jgi:hypothetical protein
MREKWESGKKLASRGAMIDGVVELGEQNGREVTALGDADEQNGEDVAAPDAGNAFGLKARSLPKEASDADIARGTLKWREFTSRAPELGLRLQVVE